MTLLQAIEAMLDGKKVKYTECSSNYVEFRGGFRLRNEDNDYDESMNIFESYKYANWFVVGEESYEPAAELNGEQLYRKVTK